MRITVLIVEDETAIADTIQYALETEGFTPVLATTGQEALERFAAAPVDLIILDVGLPDTSGFELCKQIRQQSDVPIIFLTARSEEVDRVVGLEIGGDDYVVKPFALEELLVRMNALARRASSRQSSTRLQVADLEYDLATQKVSRAGDDLSIPLMGRKILELLMRNHHRVVTKQEIEGILWEGDAPQSDVLRIHIHSLRDIIDKPYPVKLLETVRGIGYRLHDPGEAG